VITDQSGAVIPNANVSIRRDESGVKKEGSANEAGQFHADGLDEGKYLIIVNSRGFMTLMETVDLGRSETRRVSMTLGVNPNPTNFPPVSDSMLLQPQTSTAVPEFLPDPIAELPIGGGPMKLALKEAPQQHPNAAKRFFSALGHKIGL